ncbi:YitT family protein [Paracoccus liaowanqingii]|uniref:YitT family protein n=1 Tax=Paracoccus liaowanqingii TaxID=2560053 RepID=A0A4Z1CHR6_9RHOB|nr:YitT family protein [Paracoccus liaowanqingii]TGN62477.1 YitT family protein [Paracoccus liaowanqingii]
MTFRPPVTIYDLQGIAFGILLTSLGVTFLKAAALTTGQTAGAAVLLSYVLPLDFGLVFLLVSLPFLLLSWRHRSRSFTLRTVAAVLGISVTSALLGRWIEFAALPPLLAAILAGSCCGVGLLALFRHNASAGGLGVLALMVEERTGFRTGWFQMCFDALVFLVALAVLPLDRVVYSLIGAVVLNAVIGWNFKLPPSRPPETAPDA